MPEEQVVQKLARRCPYCDGELPDPQAFVGKETDEVCPHCGKTFIRVQVVWTTGADGSSGKGRDDS